MQTIISTCLACPQALAAQLGTMQVPGIRVETEKVVERENSAVLTMPDA